PLLEILFPTARQPANGTGKYQLGPAVGFPISLINPRIGFFPDVREVKLLPQIQQFFSVAGDPDRKNINYTKLQFTMSILWPKGHWLDITPQLLYDWEQSGKSAGVLEIESGWIWTAHWRTWVKVGAGLWGTGVPGSYGSLFRIGVAY